VNDLTQEELGRLGACVVHDLDSDDAELAAEYRAAVCAIKKVAQKFGLDGETALSC
jgi:hypothetical protein